MSDIVANAVCRALRNLEFGCIDISVDAYRNVIASDPAAGFGAAFVERIGKEVARLVRHSFEAASTGAFDFDFCWEFGEDSVVAFEGGGREKNADFEFGILFSGALPGGDKGAGFEHELAYGGTIVTLALAGSLAEPAADIAGVLRGD